MARDTDAHTHIRMQAGTHARTALNWKGTERNGTGRAGTCTHAGTHTRTHARTHALDALDVPDALDMLDALDTLSLLDALHALDALTLWTFLTLWPLCTLLML